MTFNSISFLVFFAVVATVHYWAPIPIWLKKVNLVVASYVFYGSWTIDFIPLLWFTTVFDFRIARQIDREINPRRRKFLCIASVGIGLSILATFKYRSFLYNLCVDLLNASGGFGLTRMDPVDFLPLGISFYTFESISYVVDVYRRRTKPAATLLDYALFVSFFPHLLSGPIVRPDAFLPQCRAVSRPSHRQVGWGLTLITIGLFQKIVVADQLAGISDRVFEGTAGCTTLDMWAGSLAFSMQIYCDFAGYTTCAIGLALCLGFVLNDNFNAPYAAIGFSDFWQRWHISLSSWLRDYLYIPLGGNRNGPARTFANLMVTMFLGGLWHGASWTFVVWGLVHGCALVAERLLKQVKGMSRIAQDLWGRFALGMLTFTVVTLTWVIFRARDLTDASTGIRAMFGGGIAKTAARLDGPAVAQVAAMSALVLTAHWMVRKKGTWAWWLDLSWRKRAALLGVMIILILLTPGEDRAFIYFQF